jgi:formate hydrogenlyase subunit 6/NADH:ubiquinone oxidoreductase subunit I
MAIRPRDVKRARQRLRAAQSWGTPSGNRPGWAPANLQGRFGLMDFGEYLRSISTASTTILEGLAVTFSHLFRKPITIQYPDRIERPVSETLPPRYRGLLEVQIDICTGCRRCERVCPIECIAIDLVKNPETRKQEMSRFDIDLGKCMFCGLCVEACKTESTGAMRHTREFEATTDSLATLVFRFVPQGTRPLYKAPKDKSEIPLGAYGPWAREARERARRDNPTELAKRLGIWRARRGAAQS